MNVDGSALLNLGQTNVSRPTLQHANSKQSITASEDYYSLSDPSSESDANSQRTVTRYRTPPSRYRTPTQSNDKLHEITAPVTRNIRREPVVSIVREEGESRPTSSTTQDKRLSRKPVPPPKDASRLHPSSAARDSKLMDANQSPSTTPGMDDTPYIRFAIDQLTRDEEVRGSRTYPKQPVEDNYPVERHVPDEGLGYTAAQPPIPPEKNPQRRENRQSTQSEAPVIRDTFVPFRPASDDRQHPRLTFLPSILRPLWLGLFIFLCIFMLAALLFCAIWSRTHDGLWNYDKFGGSRYFVFEYLPQILAMVILLWLVQIQIAIIRVVPFIAMANGNNKSRAEAGFLDLYPEHFLIPNLQPFRAGLPLIGACFVVFWLFLFTIPLIASAFNVRFFGPAGTGVWRWIASQPVIWTTIAIYILLILVLIALLFWLRRRETGLKWDPRSLADIVALLERSNIMGDYVNSETFTGKREFKGRLARRTDRLGYWHTTRRPHDIFYGIGEEGGATRRYSIEHGRIREKAPERSYTGGSVDTTSGQRPDFTVRMDLRSSKVRLRHLPWYLKDTFVILWVIIAVILLIAFLVVSFLNRAVLGGFLPEVPAATDSGFSASNFLYSFLPCLLGTVLFTSWLTLDLTLRRLQPYASLSAPGGATAEHSLLTDYPYTFPLSTTISALANGHWRIAYTSLVSFINITIPILSGGCFWTQFYTPTQSIRVAAHPAGYFALCFFLALYALSYLILIPGRRRMALPHDARNLHQIISWLYQSPLLTDRAFARPHTKADLVARLMGHDYNGTSASSSGRPGWQRSLTNLVSPSKRNLAESSGAGASKSKLSISAPLETEQSEKDKRASMLDPGAIRYGFGIHIGRDGLEHMGIDRVRRGTGREMVLFEEQKMGRFSNV